MRTGESLEALYPLWRIQKFKTVHSRLQCRVQLVCLITRAFVQLLTAGACYHAGGAPSHAGLDSSAQTTSHGHLIRMRSSMQRQDFYWSAISLVRPRCMDSHISTHA